MNLHLRNNVDDYTNIHNISFKFQWNIPTEMILQNLLTLHILNDPTTLFICFQIVLVHSKRYWGNLCRRAWIQERHWSKSVITWTLELIFFKNYLMERIIYNQNELNEQFFIVKRADIIALWKSNTNTTHWFSSEL